MTQWPEGPKNTAVSVSPNFEGKVTLLRRTVSIVVVTTM